MVLTIWASAAPEAHFKMIANFILFLFLFTFCGLTYFAFQPLAINRNFEEHPLNVC